MKDILDLHTLKITDMEGFFLCNGNETFHI